MRNKKWASRELFSWEAHTFAHLWEGELVNLLFLVNLVCYFLLLGF